MEKEKKSTPKDVTKKRNWAFVVYPESVPADWKEQLQLSGLQCAISPLHDKDLNPTGEVKKKHWHVIACYGGPTSFNSVKKLTDNLNAPGPQPLEQVRGYYRYLTHKDNPEKHQYDEREIRTLNGFNILDYMELTRNEVDEMKHELQLLILEKGFIEYGELMNYLSANRQNMRAEYSTASSNTYFFDRYLRSLRNMRESRHMNVDPATGEVL
jgi:hypothetical protein